MMKKIFIFGLIFILFAISVNAYEFGNRHSNPYWGSATGIGSLVSGEKVCQEYNMPKNGTVTVWCPSFLADGTADLTIWVSETLGGGSGSAYQGSTITSSAFSSDYMYMNDCLNMPDVTVTKNQSLWLCFYRSGGTGTYTYYAGSGYPAVDDVFYDTINYYPRYQNRVSDGRWYEDGVAVNGTPYRSAFIYSDNTGAGFPQRNQYGVPEKIIGTANGEEFYFPYDDINITNISMIFGGGSTNVYWTMTLRNETDDVSDILFTCGSNQTDTELNISGQALRSCDIDNVTLVRGYYSLKARCYQDINHTNACDNSPTYLYIYRNTDWGERSAIPNQRIGTFDYPRSNIYDYFFLLGTDQIQERTECYDGYDNDDDGTYDYPNDPDCDSVYDDSESGETNWIDDEACVFDWDCDNHHNCIPNFEFGDYVTYKCGCVNNQCTNFDTLYAPNVTISMYGNPDRMLQFGSGNFAGLGGNMYKFSGTDYYDDYYAEFSRTSLKRNQPSNPDNDAVNPSCVIDFSSSYSWADYWLENISDSSVIAHWKNQSSSGDTEYYDLAKIDEGCDIDWIQTDMPYKLTSFAQVGNYIYATQTTAPTKIFRFLKSDGSMASNITISISTDFIDDFADGFVAIESVGACADEKEVNYYNSVGTLIWSHNGTFRTYESIMADGDNVYVAWKDCSGNDNRYITKLNGTNGQMIWEVATGESSTAYQNNVKNLNSDLFYYAPDIYYHYPMQIFSKYSGELVGSTDGDLSHHAYNYLFPLDESLSVESYESEIMKPASTDNVFYAGKQNEMQIFRLYENADYDAPSPPPANTTECSDSIDNDGDGFTDYPEDPSCSGYSDNTEAPFDYTQCNDTIDNDGDGFIDLADPSCDNSADNNEYPISSSPQSEDECLVVENCILYDSIPYSDDPALHGWWDDLIESTADYEYLGGYSMFLDGYEESTDTLYILSAKKNITNPNNYNNVDGFVVLSFYDDYITVDDFGNDFYMNFLDYDQNLVASVRLTFTDVVSGYDLKADIYASDDGAWVYMGEAFFNQADFYLIRFYLDFDQENEVWDFYYEDSAGTTYSPEYDFANAGIGSIYTVQFQHAINSEEMEILVDVVELTGTEEGATVCSEFELPYYLVEYFNGYIDLCDWGSSHNIYFNGEMHITQDIPLYYTNKMMFGTIEADNTRYATVTFDLNVVNITTGDTLTFRLYDEDRINFWTIYYRDSGDEMWYDDDGTGIVAQTSIPLDEEIAYKFVIDLDDDTFDIYFNGTKVVSNAGFTDAFLNVETIDYIKITSNDAEFKLDNLKVFGSDSDGTPLMPDEDIDVTIDETVSWCGLFHKTQTSCSQDSDCETGSCLINGKCNRFDMTYCDENGHTRGNKCVIAGMTSCVLESTADVILDHFLLFLVFLIIIILVAYLFVMSKT